MNNSRTQVRRLRERSCLLSALKPSLLRLLTAHDAAGSRQIGGAEMEKHKKVSGLISDCQTCSSHVNPHATHTGAKA